MNVYREIDKEWWEVRTENLTEGMAYLTLVFNHVIPLVSYSFTLLFGFNRSENH